MVHQLEPMVLGRGAETLAASSHEILHRSSALESAAHSTTRASLRELLRAMNSYYSNRIEGQGTHPLNIERALHDDYSKKPEVAQLQRIAKAYLEAERELESSPDEPLTGAFAIMAHRAMYSRLRSADRRTKDENTIEPGALRQVAVRVGEHVPPPPKTLGAFLARYSQVYEAAARPENRLIAIACAHHRLSWIHPFEDGNGRAGRLVTHCALHPFNGGLWSVARGLARKRDEYYARLADADSPRRGALDGRGNLSLEGLTRWCRFFIDLCLDQVTFMGRLLDLDGARDRIRALVVFREPAGLRVEVALALHHLFAAGPLTRGEFKQLTGLGSRVAQTQLAMLLKQGLVRSETPLGPVQLAFPLDALQFLFPDLYPEAATKPDD